MTKELRTAYSAKEEAELLLPNLEKLKAEGSIADAQYEVLKAEYTKMSDDAISKIASIKAELQKVLDDKTRELGVFRQELSNLEARFKVGQIPAETYLKQEKEPKKKVAELEKEVSELQALVNSTSSADIGGAVGVKATKPKVEKPKEEKAPTERKAVVGGKLRYLVFGLIGVVVIIAIIFSLPLWTVPVEVTETYTETEMRQESYTLVTGEVICETPRSTKLFESVSYGGGLADIVLYPGSSIGTVFSFYPGYFDVVADVRTSGAAGLVTQQSIETGRSRDFPEPQWNSVFMKSCSGCASYKWYEPLVQMPDVKNLSGDGPYWATLAGAGENGRDCTVVMEWVSSKNSPCEMLALLIPITKAQDLPEGMVLTEWYNASLINEEARSGRIEYNLSEAAEQGNLADRYMFVCTHPQQSKTPVSFSFEFTYEWTDVEIETKEVTEYREVPVEVEKQRTVTKYEKVSMWQLLFGTGMGNEHAD